MNINSSQFAAFERVRLEAQSRLQTSAPSTQKTQDFRQLIEKKQQELYSDTTPIDRKDKTDSSFSGLLQSVGSMANHYVNSKMGSHEASQSPQSKKLGNYIDFSA